MSCSRDEQRESSGGGGSRCDGAAAQNYFATFHKIILEEKLKLLGKIILEEYLKIISHSTKIFRGISSIFFFDIFHNKFFIEQLETISPYVPILILDIIFKTIMMEEKLDIFVP